MYYSSLLPVVFLSINNFCTGVKYEVEAGAHDLVPFRSSWFGSVEKSRQIEETPSHADNNEVFAEFSNIRPRKLKTRDTFRKRAEENMRKPHDAAKKKKKKRRKRKKKPVPNPRRFIKATNAEKDKDSNMTDSIEVTKKTKPVDIIVHIKVTE